MNGKIDINGDGNIIAGHDIVLNTDHVRKLPSLLGGILPNLVSEMGKIAEQKAPPEIPYEIEDKINFNNVEIYRNAIEEYSLYGRIVDSIYENLDQSKAGSIKIIYGYLTNIYTSAKIECAKGNAKNKSDEIIKYVIGKISSDIKNSSTKNVSIEEIEMCSLVITCHGFINCKILENVPHDN